VTSCARFVAWGTHCASMPDRPRAKDPIDRLVRRTRMRLAVFTMLLVMALLVMMGVVTAFVALSGMDSAVDNSLREAAAGPMAALRAAPVDDNSGDGADTGDTGDGTTTIPVATATDPDDHLPASSDTFFLVLDGSGNLLSNPRGIVLTGLPDTTAVAAALAAGSDLRTVSAGGDQVRLLTERVGADASAPGGFLQTGFVLNLHNQQEAELLTTIVVTSLAGLLGAALVTLLVTRRALVPIRYAFATERRFVAAASHELRTPVAVIRASAEILQREDLVAEDGHSLVEDVISESDRLTRLVGDLLALAAAEAGAITIDRQPLELRSFVADLGRRADTMAQGRGAHLQVDSGPPGAAPLPVLADADRLAQLVLILVDNAIDHSPDGGTVSLALRAVPDAQPPCADIVVTDHGPGVPVADRERIFEPFARLRGRTRTQSGTGLGLAIARLLADRHQADLSVDDAPQGGARFTIRMATTTTAA